VKATVGESNDRHVTFVTVSLSRVNTSTINIEDAPVQQLMLQFSLDVTCRRPAPSPRKAPGLLLTINADGERIKHHLIGASAMQMSIKLLHDGYR
jgi:hypothetical protein